MKTFTVQPGTQGLLVTETSSSPFTTRKVLTFQREEMLFDPVAFMNGTVNHQWAQLAEHGFAGFKRTGDSGNVYILIVKYADIEVNA